VTETSWDSDTPYDPVADMKAALAWIRDPERDKAYWKRKVELEKQLDAAIDEAVKAGMLPEEIFRLLNKGIVIL
jgi:hypothetical protein